MRVRIVVNATRLGNRWSIVWSTVTRLDISWVERFNARVLKRCSKDRLMLSIRSGCPRIREVVKVLVTGNDLDCEQASY